MDILKKDTKEYPVLVYNDGKILNVKCELFTDILKYEFKNAIDTITLNKPYIVDSTKEDKKIISVLSNNELFTFELSESEQLSLKSTV